MDRTRRSSLITLLVVIVLLPAVAGASAAVVHVAPDGSDTADGRPGRPVATLQRAVDLAVENEEETVIVVHAGVYGHPVRLARTDRADPPRITITAAADDGGRFHEAVLDGSIVVDQAQPVSQRPGVYAFAIAAYSAASVTPQMWESDTRVRYTYAADLRGVALRPATFFHDADRERIVFHTSDGHPPDTHRIGLQRTAARQITRILIQRPNVTIRGLTLRHGVDIAVAADDVVIEDCRTINSLRAVIISPGARRTRVSRHHGVDIANGVMSHGNDAVVEGCTFLRPRDRFTIPLSTQDQSGIQFYAPATGGTARGNLVAGFHLGLFMKGVKGSFTIEGNTAIGPGTDQVSSYGVFNVSGWRRGDVCRNNVIAGFYMPAPSIQTFEPGFIHTGNGYWDGGDMPGLAALLGRYRESGTGDGDRIADPRFIHPAEGDYRLAHDSPLAQPGMPPPGAREVAPADVPVHRPAVPAIAAHDREPAAPVMIDTPRERANRHGVSLRFHTSLPCEVNTLWGLDAACLNRLAGPRRIERRYDSNVGNEFNLVDEPLRRTDHFATIVVDEEVPAGTDLFYRLELVDAVGTTMLTDVRKVKLAGEPRVWRVAPSGQDEDAHGELRTIQAAVDRALPGDRIVVADGLYGDRVVIRHGGVLTAPLIIEAEHEHQALIDTDHDQDIHAVVQIDGARHVTLRGLEFRWFHAYAIYAWQTAGLSVERCKFWNMHFTKGRRSGVGVFTTRSSDLRIDHCLFFNLNAAFDILRTQGFTITHNTAMRLTHRVALFADSGPGRLRNNSFTFTGNYHYHLSLSPRQLAEFDSDYNNLAQYVHMSYAEKDHPTPQELAEMLDVTGEDAGVYPLGNKGIVSVSGRAAETVPFFGRWQRKYGKDLRSVFAHPRYLDPRRHDFRVPPGSPNVGAGEGGVVIGACDVAAP